MILGILTLGYDTGALIAGEIGVVTIGSTVFAADDITGTTIGAAKNDLDGDYKPLKSVFRNVGGDAGTIKYFVLNLDLGLSSKFNNLKNISFGKTGAIIPNLLDNNGLINSCLETKQDIINASNPKDEKK